MIEEQLVQQTIVSAGLLHYITLSVIIFVIGVCGIFLNKKNIITILMSLELILVAVNINFVAFSHELNDLIGQVYVIFTLTVAAAEIAVGLAILISFFRNIGNIKIDNANLMRG